VRRALSAGTSIGIGALLLACGGASKAVPSGAASSRALSAAVAPSSTSSETASPIPPTAAQPAVVSTSAVTPTTAPALAPPPIHQWPIPFGRARKQQMAAYSLRHYGEDTYVLSRPKVIVEHYTETDTAQEAYNTFAPDVPDSEFGELPNTCAHFLVEQSGRIDQLVPLSVRCRHTTGLNWTAIGIENVGRSDAAILGDRAQISASLQLTRWLRCRYSIPLADVIGHNESLSSPYHHDRVAAFQHQTHSDFDHTDMRRYRTRLARLPCPAGSFSASPQTGTGGT